MRPALLHLLTRQNRRGGLTHKRCGYGRRADASCAMQVTTCLDIFTTGELLQKRFHNYIATAAVSVFSECPSTTLCALGTQPDAGEAAGLYPAWREAGAAP